jgi:DNA-directed RNA polymerase subunit RPC12/RpoP
MVQTDFVVLSSYDNPVEANIVKGRLESEDIYCFLAGEHYVGLIPLHSNLAGGIRIFVKPEDYEKGLAILKEDLDDYKKLISCKSCGSNNVHYVSTMKDPGNWFALLLSFFLFFFSFATIPIHIKKVYVCDNCGHENESMD